MRKYLRAWMGLFVLMAGYTAQAQESYFNVPEAQVAERYKLMAQNQVSIDHFLMDNFNADLGLGSGWQVGVNLYDLDLHRLPKAEPDEEPLPSKVLINGQKEWLFKKDGNVGISLGSQQGMELRRDGKRQYAGSFYALLGGRDWPFKGMNSTLGGYVANTPLLGDGHKICPVIGAEYALWDHKLHVIAEHFGGNNDLGGTALGLEVFLAHRLPLALGYRIANQGAEGSFLIQLTLMGED